MLAYPGLTVEVRARDDRVLEWLEEFLAPHLTVVEGAEADRHVELVVDQERYLAVRRRGAAPGGPTGDCFVLDSGVVSLPFWEPADERVLFDEHLNVFFSFAHDGPVSVLAAVDNARSRVALMRVVREFAMSRARRRGALLMHAAAVDVRRRGLMIAGPKGAGKTTLLLYLLQYGGARFVANDRLFLTRTAGGVLSARGMPTIVTVRRESVQWFPGLAARVAESGHHHGITVREALASSARPAAADDLPAFWGLSHVQLCDVLGVSAVAETPLTVVVFPRVAGAATGIRLDPLEPSGAARAWAGAVFGPPGATTLFDEPSASQVMSDATRLSSELARHVPSFECWLGDEAYRSGAAARMLFERLIG